MILIFDSHNIENIFMRKTKHTVECSQRPAKYLRLYNIQNDNTHTNLTNTCSELGNVYCGTIEYTKNIELVGYKILEMNELELTSYMTNKYIRDSEC